MSRGGSYGGGKSSLSYLFEPDETAQSATNSTAKKALKPQAKEHENTNDKPQVCLHIAKPGEKPQTTENSKTKTVEDGKPPKHIGSDDSNHKNHSRNAVYFHNGRPSTKVNSVPGGRSSLGYLFGGS